MVLEAAAAAVWRISDGLVGGGVFLRLESNDDGNFDFDFDAGAAALSLDLAPINTGFGRDSADAAVLAESVDGPLVIGYLFSAAFDETRRAAIVF